MMLLLLQRILRCSAPQSMNRLRMMSSIPKSSPGSSKGTSHIERTAAEPRDESLHRVILSHVDEVNDRIRVLRLDIPRDRPQIKFLPGQWLDVNVPGIPKPGGFTITSTPASTRPRSKTSSASRAYASLGYLELAVQASPMNPAAAWLWRPVPEIVNQDLQVRVGGSFVWPPPNVDIDRLKRIVFIAGGVGVNPLMSIIAHLAESTHEQPYEISFLYSVREPDRYDDISSILFLDRLAGIFFDGKIKGGLVLHLTQQEKEPHSRPDGMVEIGGRKIRCRRRRIRGADLLDEVGEVDQRQHTVCYICGVPAMTDELVAIAQEAEGMDPRKVMFERWW